MLYGQHCIEQEHTLVRPAGQVAVTRVFKSQVTMQFLVDVHKACRSFDTLWHRKAQPHCLPWLVVRVLAENDYPNLVKRGGIEGVEDQLTWWKDGLSRSDFRSLRPL